MIKQKNGLLILALFLVLSTVTALEVKKTEFILITNPYANLSVSVQNADGNEEVELFEGKARKFGEYRFTYYGTVDQVNLVAKMLNNETGQVLLQKTFGPYVLGTPSATVNFTLEETTQETSQEVIEETTQETSEQTGQQTNPIQGLVVDQGSEFNKVYYFVAAGAIGLVVLLIVLRKKLLVKSSAPTEPHPSKVVKKKVDSSQKTEAPLQQVDKQNESNINDTEKRIADLQKQLDQIRNEEKLAKLQKQINLERQSLKRLQDENEDKPSVQQNNNFQDQNKIN